MLISEEIEIQVDFEKVVKQNLEIKRVFTIKFGLSISCFIYVVEDKWSWMNTKWWNSSCIVFVTGFRGHTSTKGHKMAFPSPFSHRLFRYLSRPKQPSHPMAGASLKSSH